MPARILLGHKKLCIVSGSAAAVILLAAYLYALFLPGVWHGDAFLYRQKDGSFAGSDHYADYQMRINAAETGTDIFFTVEETEKRYRIAGNAGTSHVRIYEGDTQVFLGEAVSVGDSFLLVDENGRSDDIWVTADNVIPDAEELFPGYSQLYNWAVMERCETRGNLAMLSCIFIIAAFLILDLIFPNLFFNIRYRLAVDGGEPSDWYRAMQRFSRILLGIGIVVCIVLSFTTH